jgi:PhzF family phenazine biosynthesis protein
MQLPIYQVDAFTSRVFSGNPAAVVALSSWPDDALLLSIAAENNLSETAFFCPRQDGSYSLRWFTPTVEVDLCGHATLACAWVIFNEPEFRNKTNTTNDTVLFHSQSGLLSVTQLREAPLSENPAQANQQRLLTLDFPARPPCVVEDHNNFYRQLFDALGITEAEAIVAARDLIVVLENEAQVRALTPDFTALSAIDRFAICVTARGDHCDFVSRFFAPKQGINEDPVTGSAHCSLAPYWQQRLGKDILSAEQISARGGQLHCTVRQDRVEIRGAASLYLRGTIYVG